jgi:hypothetical protein
MKSAKYLLAAALTMGVSGTAMAQGNPPQPTPAPVLAPVNDAGLIQSHWTAAGFIGSNWGSQGSAVNLDSRRSTGFGGELAYMWKGIVGGEFLADFTPSFGASSPLLAADPHVNSYMANAIGVVPLGSSGQFQPFVSGGYGAMRMGFSNGVHANGPTVTPISSAEQSTSSVNQGGWGSNIGGGVMVFKGKVGFRGGARYFHANTIDTLSGTTGEQVTQSLLSDLAFWRTDVGVSLQW